ncbi:hypothetical protein [Lysinibacillus xylanilyticus]|uniref:hypothetical protein n=1 Tax=Lysinibacillus xylanilyticus TaxID=582475 RepID=UPI003D08FB6C
MILEQSKIGKIIICFLERINRSENHNTYPKEIKLAAVQNYISGSYSLRELLENIDFLAHPFCEID